MHPGVGMRGTWLRSTRLAVGMTLLALALHAPATAGAQGCSLELATRLVGGSEARESVSPLRALVVLEPQLAENELTRVAAIDVPGPARIELPPGTVWSLHLELDGFWSPTTSVSCDTPGPIEVPVRPTGRLEGRITTRGVQVPATILVGFTPVIGPDAQWRRPPSRPGSTSSSGHRQPSGGVECPVGEGGAWSCNLPAGQLDLHLKAPGFASVFRWHVAVRPGLETSLGDLPLEPGSSVFGFVRSAIQGLDLGRIEIRVAPAGLHPSPGSLHLDDLTRTTRPDDHGFFQFRDLAAGYYAVDIRGSGFAPVQLTPVLLLAGRETDLGEPLVLDEPSLLTVRVSPPASQYDKPWKLRLVPRDQRLPLLEGNTDSLGSWFTSEPMPGRYRLLIGGPDDERWLTRDVDVSAGNQVVDVEISHFAVEGTVSRGGKPVRARITFKDAADRRSIVLYSDFEGRFQGWLPEEGVWSVTLLFEPHGAQQEIDPVPVEAVSGGPAHIDLEVPETTLLGIVRGADGEPAAGVRVNAWNRERSRHGSSADTDEAGRFRFSGLPEGRYTITAFRGAQSGTAKATLEATGAPSEIEVRLLGSRSWTARVISNDGPVPGAEVSIRAEVAAPRHIPYAKATTGPLGELATEIPADAQWLDVAVLAVGHSAHLTRIAPEAQPEIFVNDLGGNLVLDLGGGSVWSAVLGHDNGWIHVGSLLGWAQVNGHPPEDGDVLVLPAMEPGAYRLCRSIEARDCDSAFLAPHGSAPLTLEVRDAG